MYLLKVQTFLFFILSFFILGSIFLSKPTLASAATVTGTVKDSLANAISGATVNIYNPGTATDVVSPTTTTIDGTGSYTFNDVPLGTYDIKVTPPSGSNFSPVIALSQHVTSNTTLNFILTPSGSATLDGYLYDSTGTIPLANSHLAVYRSSDNALITETDTDQNGHYSVQVLTGTYNLNFSGRPDLTVNAPGFWSFKISNYQLTQSTTNLNFTLPLKKVIVHIQDATNTPVSGIQLQIPLTIPNTSLSFSNGLTASTSQVGYGTSPALYAGPLTDQSGNATLWLFPTNGTNKYTINAVPPSVSIYVTFGLNNIAITSDPVQTELISLQYNHATPITTANLATQLVDQTYSDPTTVTLSATAASGYTVATTYYKIDGGSSQIYTAPFNTTGNGQHSIEYWSVDNSGVQETPNSKTFTIVTMHNLTGIVYVDSNQNGLQDLGEDGYSGATLTLDSGQTVTTDTSGAYTISNLPSGTYIEALTVPMGFMATTINPATIALSADTTQNFGILPLPTATPTPANTPTPTETPAPTPTETPSPTPTNTPTPTETPTPTPTQTPSPTPTDTLTPTPIPTYNVTGVVFVDANNNGFQETGEAGFANATVTLSGDGNQVVQTNASGSYTLAPLPTGNYTVTLTTPGGYTHSTTNPVNIPLTADTTVNFGIALAPTATPTNTPTPTPTNAPPVITAVNSSTTTVQVNTSVALNGAFTDQNAIDTHIVSWNWGDGTTSTGTVTEANGSGTVTNNHTYTSPGVYTVVLTVTDNLNATDTKDLQYITVFDPSNGWATGDREYTSPAGSLISNPTTSGIANFGFTAKYVNGVLQPVGNKWASVSFDAGSIDFIATSYQSLVIVNNKIILRGIGSLNNTPGYRLLISAIDGGNHGTSFIRYQIKNSLGTVVYDTQPGATDTTNPTTPLAKGKIQIH